MQARGFMPNGLMLKLRPKGSQTSTPPRRNNYLKDPKAKLHTRIKPLLKTYRADLRKNLL